MLTFKQSNKVLAIIFYLIYNLNQCLISAGQLDNMNHEMPTDANQFNALQMNNPQMGQLTNNNAQQSLGLMSGLSDLRVFPFVIDPLIIIALIALPTIGLLGISSLIMPLIPIAIYLIQLFFPVGGSGKRRKRDQSFQNLTDSSSNSYYNNEINHFIINLSKAFDKYTPF